VANYRTDYYRVYFRLRRRRSPLLRFWKTRLGELLAGLPPEALARLEAQVRPEDDALALLRRLLEPLLEQPSPSPEPPPPAPSAPPAVLPEADPLPGLLWLARALRSAFGYQPTPALSVAGDVGRPAVRALAALRAAMAEIHDPEIRTALAVALEEAAAGLREGRMPPEDPELDPETARSVWTSRFPEEPR
jgi:hypothetical protein